MSAELLAELRAASLTYPEVCATQNEPMPAGYGHLERVRDLREAEFDSAVERLMTWQVQETAGLWVSASARRVEEDAVAEMFLGPRWIGVRAVCRVVYVIDEFDRVGFAYGTLTGHAETGEESFVLDRRSGRPRFIVRAFSNPASRLARLGGPISGRVQQIMTDRYLDALLPKPKAAR